MHVCPYCIIILVLASCKIYSYIISEKSRFSKKKIIVHKMCVLILSTNMSDTFLIVRRIESDIIIKVHKSSCKLPVILARF